MAAILLVDLKGAVGAAICDVPRLALVVGNGSYVEDDGNALSVSPGARSFARTSRTLGFETRLAENLPGTEMSRVFAAFEAEIKPGAVALLFFSGYGVQVEGHDYLLPVDASLWSEEDVKTRGFNLDRILASIEQKGAKAEIVVIDAARRNPFERRFRSGGSAGLAPLRGPRNVAATFALDPEKVADDADAMTSDFVDDLDRRMSEPAATARSAFRQTQMDIARRTHGRQKPWVSFTSSDDLLLDCRPEVSKRDASSRKMPGDEKSESPAPTASTEAPNAGPTASDRTASAGDEDGLDKLVRRCDELAAYPSDPHRPSTTPGVAFGHIAVDVAVPACRKAHAVDPSNPRISFELGRSLLQVRGEAAKEAVQLFRTSNSAGYVAAAIGLGAAYANGIGVDKDLSLAVRWYLQGANRGDCGAMGMLARFYASGSGVDKNVETAFDWARRSANAGSSFGMDTLGRFYLSGTGVATDATQAVAWFRKSADEGFVDAMADLGIAYEKGLGVAKDPASAKDWFRRGAEGGSSVAELMVGRDFYLDHDFAQAMTWYRKAADHKNPDAIAGLKRLQ